ncbi:MULTISPECIES: hypothetical protein [unclassified Microcoleus]|uniref:hypothetical protein n=1 Tax=unclassified Microcoleus TaxID=2642155 RepID=UPI002FD4D762
MLHFPRAGESEINQRLREKFVAPGVNAWLDRANNAIALIPDRNPQKSIAITADKDEIGILENLALMQALLDNHSQCFLSFTE